MSTDFYGSDFYGSGFYSGVTVTTGGGGGGALNLGMESPWQLWEIFERPDRFRKHRETREQLKKDLEEAYNKVHGIKQVETVSQVLEVVADAQQIREEILELPRFDHQAMLADVKAIEAKAAQLVRVMMQEEEALNIAILS